MNTADLALWGLLLGPFVQEDAAVFSAAGLAMLGGVNAGKAFGAVYLGLILSDVWKYWAGRLARSHSWCRAVAEKPGVAAARDKVVNHLALAMLTARFVPGTRIPLYVASGFFKAPFLLFFVYMAGSGALYVGIVFAAFHLVGEVAGPMLAAYLPVIAGALILAALGVLLWRGRRRGRRAAAAAAVAAMEPMAVAAAGTLEAETSSPPGLTDTLNHE
jgi:membrane protein DedA with SNARE-associated domain